MRLYLLRHGHALRNRDDTLRPLSATGKRSITALAEFLASHAAFKHMPVWHSPLVRSIESAQLFTNALLWDETQLTETGGLLPDDPPSRIAKVLKSHSKDTLIVGHEPHLSALTSLLLTGKAEPAMIKIKKGALVCLQRKDTRGSGRKPPTWRVRWHINPELYE
jgi:phosphohistidine phosphatase